MDRIRRQNAYDLRWKRPSSTEHKDKTVGQCSKSEGEVKDQGKLGNFTAKE